MVRLNLLLISCLTLAQSQPFGCAPVPDGNDNASFPDRGTIETTATAAPEAEVGTTVTLTATATASDGSEVSFSWLQTAGPGVPLTDADKSEATFSAPSLETDSTLTFLVTTTNAAGDAGRAETNVTVFADPNFGQGGSSSGGGTTSQQATANAGLDQSVEPRTTVTLDGSASRGSALKFSWRQLAGAAVVLKDASAPQSTFVSPNFTDTSADRLEFELQVTDSRNRTSTDRIIVTVLPTGGGNIDEKPRVEFATTMGNFTVELDREKAPISVENFLQYVDAEFYDGTIFHRVISGFVVQGGGFNPGLSQKPTRDPIKNEASNGLSNLRGTLAMARTSDPNSATSQFYVNLVDNTDLDASSSSAGYAVFGKVISGLDVVDRIGQVSTGTKNGFEDVPLTDVIVNSARRIR